MKFLLPTKAKIDCDLRRTFERYGVSMMQMMLSGDAFFLHEGISTYTKVVHDDILAWLTEQHQEQEFRYTWTTIMELSITLFVFAELMIDIWKICKGSQ